MTAFQLAIAADALILRSCRDRAAPCYTEEAFARKLRVARGRLGKLPRAVSRPAIDYLFQREWAEIVALAGLTAAQAMVLELRSRGLTFEEIGRRRGCTKQGAQNVLAQAVRKIDRAREASPVTGLCETYRELTAAIRTRR